jgi:hypothetical protein
MRVFLSIVVGHTLLPAEDNMAEMAAMAAATATMASASSAGEDRSGSGCAVRPVLLALLSC